jgi:hypothetical protein
LLGPVLRPGGGGSDGVDHLDALGDLAEDGLSPPVRRCCTPWCRCSTPSTSPWAGPAARWEVLLDAARGRRAGGAPVDPLASAHLDSEGWAVRRSS